MTKDKIQLGGTAHSPEDVESVHELGLQFAEIPITDPKKFSSNKTDYKTLKEKLGIFYLGHGPREGDPNDIKALKNVYLPKLMYVLSIIPKLDMKLLTIHLWLDPRFVSEDAISYKIGLLERVLTRAEDLGIVICLENLSETATHLAGVFNALPLLQLTLDIGHAQLLSEENTSFGFMARFPERIKHIHIHDNLGGDSPKDDLHLPVGEGIIDFGKIVKELNVIGYNGTISLELKPWKIKKCLGYVKQLFKGAEVG
ncbi:MAG: sugar phosphate isomerase/epimerase [Desulfobacteraceae bacterium]|nr:sugar phosphate isomerase/epimerase [Desulfobacteraceae bacterium]